METSKKMPANRPRSYVELATHKPGPFDTGLPAAPRAREQEPPGEAFLAAEHCPAELLEYAEVSVEKGAANHLRLR